MIFKVIIDIIFLNFLKFYIVIHLKGKVMENQPINNFTNLNTDSQGTNGADINTQNAPQNEPVLNNTPPQTNPYQAGVNPAQENQYTQTHTAPYYTAPAVPYNQTITQNTQQSPSAIYNNNCNGTAPQYHYGAPMNTINFNNAYYQEHQQKLLLKRQAEKKIRSISTISASSLIAFLLVAVMFAFVLDIQAIALFRNSSLSASSFIDMIYTLIVVGGTFAVFKGFFKQHSKQQSLQTGGVDPYEFKTSLSAPKNAFQAALLVFISFGGCMLANYFSSIITSFLSSFGLESTYSSIENPQSVTDAILMFISVAIVPSLIEEYAMRGVLLSGLRRYGNTFAIVASAILFGVFHGNVSQIPFAFVCGLFFAYAVIATGSIWTGIIVHIMNNSLSCISSILIQVADEEAANTFFYTVSIGGIILALCCAVIYYYVFKDDGVFVFKGDAIELTTGQKLKKFFANPVMIITILIYLAQALLLTTT